MSQADEEISTSNVVDEPEVTQNDHLLLIVGESTTGKSASLRNLLLQEDANGKPDYSLQPRVMYLNCEAGKRLPFKNKFSSFTITDPMQVLEAFDVAETTDDYDIIVIDTLTFLMDMFESVYVLNAANTMQAWGQYQQFFKLLMQDKVAKCRLPVLILAHTKDELDEKKMEMKTSVPVKGALKNNGIEAYFSTVVATKRIAIKDLEKTNQELLTITAKDRELGFKHVFQVALTAKTTGERLRAPMGMFPEDLFYADNDAQRLLAYLHEYYS